MNFERVLLDVGDGAGGGELVAEHSVDLPGPDPVLHLWVEVEVEVDQVPVVGPNCAARAEP